LLRVTESLPKNGCFSGFTVLALSKYATVCTIYYSGTKSLIHGGETFLRSCQLCSFSRTWQHFMEPKGSLPCSQEPSTSPYILSQIDSVHTIQPISPRSILILSTHLRLGLTSGLFPSGFPTNILYAFFFSSPFVLHALPSSSSLTDHSSYTWQRIQVMKWDPLRTRIRWKDALSDLYVILIEPLNRRA
jgi:hypothetical protein